ncbi:hypothetical protein [Janibacter melonis]|uniref:hypothetical protein n=1 Tax=Janibacter melonis TaxID=262209 RepID=UPI002094923A|nr:hypothetical protein [Janibacter melonis]
MATGFTAMKLGAVKYIIPFCFALNPALVAQAGAGEIAYTFAFAVVGVVFMGSAFEGWLPVAERPLGLLTWSSPSAPVWRCSPPSSRAASPGSSSALRSPSRCGCSPSDRSSPRPSTPRAGPGGA